MTPQQYFEEHTLDEVFLKETFAVSYTDNQIVIPIYDAKGRLLYCRYRHLDGSVKFTNDKGAHPALFALHKIKSQQQVVLCEGEPDAMRLWQEKIPAVCGTAGVKTFSPKLAEPLKGKEVLIVLDNDEAGESAIEKYYNTIKEVGATPYIVTLPKDYKDICEYFTAGYTKDDFLSLPHQTIDDWFVAHTPEEYTFETDSELLERKLPEDEWLVDHILPTEGFAFIVGAEATGKSFYTLTLGNCVATGKPWLNAKDKDGRPLFGVKKQAKVLFIDKENTKRRIQSRMRGLGIRGTGNMFWLKYPHYFELSDPNEEDGFSKIAKAASRKVKQEGIKLIIVDSFADVMIGNENAAGDVQKFFDGFRQLFPGCSILVLHHASKPAAGVTRSTSQRARGSTNIMAQIYSGFFVESVPKSKVDFTLEQTKAGDAEKLNKFMVGLDVKPIYLQPNKTSVVGLLYKGEVIDAEMKVTEAIEAIEEKFKAVSTIPRQDLLEMLQAEGISQRTIGRAIKQLTDEGVIESVPDEHLKNRKNYVWNGEREGLYE